MFLRNAATCTFAASGGLSYVFDARLDATGKTTNLRFIKKDVFAETNGKQNCNLRIKSFQMPYHMSSGQALRFGAAVPGIVTDTLLKVLFASCHSSRVCRGLFLKFV